MHKTPPQNEDQQHVTSVIERNPYEQTIRRCLIRDDVHFLP